MRKFIIDTDTGSDDAVALLMALFAMKQEEIEILGFTTVAGNISLKQATANCLTTLELAKKVFALKDIPVHTGAVQPLKRMLVTAEGVHGKDGLGDQGLVCEDLNPTSDRAIDFILEKIKENPHEIEIIALGPVTNLALALQKEPETMAKIKHIYSMGTAGFGAGNCSPVAEFNVYVDAEAYAQLLSAGIPLTIIGFDLCVGEGALNEADFAEIRRFETKQGDFVLACTRAILKHNICGGRGAVVDLPDPVAMAVALWPEVIDDLCEAYAYCCTVEEPAYGQVILFEDGVQFSVPYTVPQNNCLVIKKIRPAVFKHLLFKVLQEN